MTSVDTGILLALHEHKRIVGTDTLAEIVGTRQEYITPAALRLHRLGLIRMEIGTPGRGHKSVYEDKGVISVENAGTRP